MAARSGRLEEHDDPAAAPEPARQPASTEADHGLAHAYAARDWVACARIVDRWWPEIGFSAQSRLVQRIAHEMPLATVRSNMGMWHRAEYYGRLPLGEAPVQIPVQPAHIDREIAAGSAPVLLKRVIMAMIARRIRHRNGDARDLAVASRPLAEATIRCHRDGVSGAAAYWCLQAGVSHELFGEFDEALSLYRLGWEARRFDTTGHAAVDLAGKMTAQAAWRGDRVEATGWLREETRGFDPDQWFTPHLRLGYHQTRVLLADDLLDRETAQANMVEIRRPVTTDESWSIRLAVVVHHLLTWGEAQEAYDVVAAAVAERPGPIAGEGMHAALTHTLLADAALALGRGAQAARHLQEASGPGASPVEVRFRLLQGDPAGAVRAAEVALGGRLWRRHRLQLLLLRAAAAQQLGERETAVESARRAVVQVRAQGDLRVLCTVSRSALEALTADVPDLGELLDEIDRRGGGEIYPAAAALVELTEREAAVLDRLAAGRSLREAADDLVVSVNTVKTQTRSLYKRLGVTDRKGLMTEAVRLGLVERGVRPDR